MEGMAPMTPSEQRRLRWLCRCCAIIMGLMGMVVAFVVLTFLVRWIQDPSWPMFMIASMLSGLLVAGMPRFMRDTMAMWRGEA